MAGNNGGGWLKDALSGPDGEKSSKRLVGFTLTAIGVLWFIAAGIVQLCTGYLDAELIKYIGSYLVGAGVGLLGFGTLAERIGR